MKSLILNEVQQVTLDILQKLRIGQYLKVRSIAKKDPEKFRDTVKQLIDFGYSEYEFTNDYTEIRRLDLPNYAKDYFTQLRNYYEQNKQNNDGSDSVAKVNTKT
ncbi:hypothetical protein [Sphingobacterium sp. 1.A.4]|uniref:hypothetical protein n=1 Tax=Sphingobacterium sp. 1.A.4 TaxID=2044603 RepID=UPI000C0BE2F3|nr:hypothetical protein [Sphingobacterium sp. 1.A.4]